MQSNQGYGRGRRYGSWIFALGFVAFLSLIAISIIFSWNAGYHQYFFFFGWWFFIPLLFFGFFLFRWWGWGYWWGRRSYYGYDPALEALRERFARGEITREQYEEMRRELDR